MGGAYVLYGGLLVDGAWGRQGHVYTLVRGGCGGVAVGWHGDIVWWGGMVVVVSEGATPLV